MHDHLTVGAPVAQPPLPPVWHTAWAAVATGDPATIYAALQELAAVDAHQSDPLRFLRDVLQALTHRHALDLYINDPALTGLTDQHRTRAGQWLDGRLSALRHCYLDGRPPDGHERQAVLNVREFLDRFPRLTIDDGPPLAYRLAGKRPAGFGSRALSYRGLPGSDHTVFWRVRGIRGPVVATTFPYHWDAAAHVSALSFAARFGLRLEVRPPDVPDMYFPGSTVPIVWSRAGVDWRAA